MHLVYPSQHAPTHGSSSLLEASLRPRDETCGFEGDPDLYGLGIRLGIYLQYFSAVIMRLCRDLDSLESQSDAYLMFTFALFVTTLIRTSRAGETHAVEIVMLGQIMIGGFNLVNRRFSARLKEGPGDIAEILRIAVTLALDLAVNFYGIWFWLVAVPRGLFLETPCGSWVFLFAKAPLHNRHVANFLTSACVFAILVLLANSWRLAKTAKAKFTSSTDSAALPGQHEESSQAAASTNAALPPAHDAESLPVRASTDAASPPTHHGESPENRGKESSLFGFWERWQLSNGPTLFLISVLAVELTLQWNNVTGVYTIEDAGQLIPFTIGLTTFVQVVLRRFLPSVTTWLQPGHE